MAKKKKKKKLVTSAKKPNFLFKISDFRFGVAHGSRVFFVFLDVLQTSTKCHSSESNIGAGLWNFLGGSMEPFLGVSILTTPPPLLMCVPNNTRLYDTQAIWEKTKERIAPLWCSYTKHFDDFFHISAMPQVCPEPISAVMHISGIIGKKIEKIGGFFQATIAES